MADRPDPTSPSLAAAGLSPAMNFGETYYPDPAPRSSLKIPYADDEGAPELRCFPSSPNWQ